MVNDIKASKLLALVLRHRPQAVGIELDKHGWTAVPELLTALESACWPIDREQLMRVGETSDKNRYAYDAATDRIRANQGHSVAVDLGLSRAVPPEVLFHGTPVRNRESILREGLRKGSRHAVHLSPDPETAARVGARRGTFLIFEIDAARMHADGHDFTVSDNGVWLVDSVPPQYLQDPGR